MSPLKQNKIVRRTATSKRVPAIAEQRPFGAAQSRQAAAVGFSKEIMRRLRGYTTDHEKVLAMIMDPQNSMPVRLPSSGADQDTVLCKATYQIPLIASSQAGSRGRFSALVQPNPGAGRGVVEQALHTRKALVVNDVDYETADWGANTTYDEAHNADPVFEELGVGDGQAGLWEAGGTPTLTTPLGDAPVLAGSSNDVPVFEPTHGTFLLPAGATMTIGATFTALSGGTVANVSFWKDSAMATNDGTNIDLTETIKPSTGANVFGSVFEIRNYGETPQWVNVATNSLVGVAAGSINVALDYQSMTDDGMAAQVRPIAMSVWARPAVSAIEDGGSIVVAALPEGVAETKFMRQSSKGRNLQKFGNIQAVAAACYSGNLRNGGYVYYVPGDGAARTLHDVEEVNSVKYPTLVVSGMQTTDTGGGYPVVLEITTVYQYTANTTALVARQSRIPQSVLDDVIAFLADHKVPRAMENDHHRNIIQKFLRRLESGRAQKAAVGMRSSIHELLPGFLQGFY